jgi:hypothetical protein
METINVVIDDNLKKSAWNNLDDIFEAIEKNPI